jgi:hypothetical protein
MGDITLTADALRLLDSPALAEYIARRERERLTAHRERLRREERAKGPDKGKGGSL